MESAVRAVCQGGVPEHEPAPAGLGAGFGDDNAVAGMTVG
jgi:hypothetical protein